MNWLQKIAFPLQPGYEEIDTTQYSDSDPNFGKYRVPEIVQDKEIIQLDGNPFLAKVDNGGWRGITYFMNIANEKFLHFTTPQKAKDIIRDGNLRLIHSDRAGRLGICAISLTCGEYVPGVQLSTQHPDDLVSLIFTTSTLPEDNNYHEEVVWSKTVELTSSKITSFNEGMSLIEQFSIPLDDNDTVAYVNDENIHLLRESA